MNSIHQSEQGGGSKVSLGSFKTLVENEDGSFQMKFEDGQHCHAFGPRSASVHITCGSANVLSDASEPSTCFYTFQMESPAACSVKFGNRNHLL
jgi:Glucosidase II beta subunit-like protein